MGAALNVRRTIHMSLQHYDAAVVSLLNTAFGCANSVHPALPLTLDRFVRGSADARNPLFAEVTRGREVGPTGGASFALASCQLVGPLQASDVLAKLCMLPENAPIIVQLVGLTLETDDALDAFITRFGAPLAVLCRGDVSGSGVCTLIAESTVALGEESCTLSGMSDSLRRRHKVTPAVPPGKHTAQAAFEHGWLDAVYPDGSSESEAHRLAARLAQISSALLISCKKLLPATSVEAAVLAMGALHRRKPRAAGAPLVRVTADDTAGVAVVQLCDEQRSNTISHELAVDVLRAATSVRRQRAIRAIALYGKGAHFSVGVNPYNYSSGMRAPLAASAYSCEQLLEGFVQLRGLCVPFICAVHGKLIGAALAASLNADYMVADVDATFCHGNIVRGVCPLGMLSQTLVKAVGRSCALCMYLTNESVSSKDAMGAGLVQEVLDSVETVQRRAIDLAWFFAQSPEDSKSVVDARALLDSERIASEALGHASCLEANGGRYASSELMSPNDAWPTGFTSLQPVFLEHAESVNGSHAVHQGQVPALLTLDALNTMCQWPEDELLVIRGMPEAENFCLGGNPTVERVKNGEFLHDVPAFAQLSKHLQQRSIPTIVVCHGATRGFGMLFPCMATCVLAYTDATFGFPEVRRGVLPGVVSVGARRRLTPAVCDWLFCTGEAFDAKQAQRLGLVDSVSEVKLIDAQVAAFSHNLGTASPQLPIQSAFTLPVEIDTSRRIVRLAVTATTEPESVCKTLAAVADAAHAQAWSVVVLNIEGATTVSKDSSMLGHDAISQLSATVLALASAGIVVLCSLCGHVTRAQLLLSASAHYRAVNAQATCDSSSWSTFADALTHGTFPDLLSAEGMQKAVQKPCLCAQGMLEIKFASELVDTDMEEHLLRFAQWLTKQPPLGIKHMLRLTFSTHSSISEAPNRSTQMWRTQLHDTAAETSSLAAPDDSVMQSASAAKSRMRERIVAPGKVYAFTELSFQDLEPFATSAKTESTCSSASPADQLQHLLALLGAGTSSTEPSSSVASVSEVVRTVAKELVGPAVSIDAPLMQAGLDSLGATEFRSRLSEQLGGVDLPATIIFDFPTIRQIEEHVTTCVTPQAAPATRSAAMPDIQSLLALLGAGTSSTEPSSSVASVSEVVRTVAKELVGPVVSIDAPLMQAGLDSLGATEFRSRLSEQLGGVDLPATIIFDFPTIRQIEAHLKSTVVTKKEVSKTAVAETLRQLASAQVPVKSVSRAKPAKSSTSVALSGCAILAPSAVDTVAKFTGMLVSSTDVVTEVPLARWNDAMLSAAPKGIESRRKHMAFVRNADKFDNEAFDVPPAEATVMDPQQRLLLEFGYEALHAGRVERSELLGSSTAVYVAVTFLAFEEELRSSIAGSSVFAGTGSALSVVAGRLSYALGIHGPSLVIETACSAALAACHAAATGFRNYECELALSGAVNLILSPIETTRFAVAGMTSPTGRSHTFDARADGYARGEACSGIALCDTPDGLALLGSAVRQDGRSASLTAPNGQAQQGLLTAAMRDGGMSADALSLNEAHGTGTALGDPIEAGSLAGAVLARRTEPLAVGGVKANIGHAEPAAGMTGLLKLALGLKSSEAAPNAQLRLLNPHLRHTLRYGASALQVQSAALAIDGSGGGGVSSFGYSGTIVHAILGIEHQLSRTLALSLAEGAVLDAEMIAHAYRRTTFLWPSITTSQSKALSQLSVSQSIIPDIDYGKCRVDKELVDVTIDQFTQIGVIELKDVAHFNALGDELGASLAAAICHVRVQVSVKSFVLQSASPHFCIGGNPHGTHVHTPVALLAGGFHMWARTFGMLRELGGRLIAAVHGYLAGGGIALCLNSSYVISDWDASFEHGNLPRGDVALTNLPPPLVA